METKIHFFWRKGGFDKVHPEPHPCLFSFIFQDSEESCRQAGEGAEEVFVGGDAEQKISWISWGSACLSKEKGGLGIKDLSKFNSTLLGKWQWNLFHHQGELWARVLDSKYGGWRKLDENRRNLAESVWWQDLRSTYKSMGKGNWFKRGIRWSAGCGSKVRFLGGWVEGRRCSVDGPIPYTLSDAAWEWNLQWRRFLLESETVMGANFLEDLQDLSIDPNHQD